MLMAPSTKGSHRKEKRHPTSPNVSEQLMNFPRDFNIFSSKLRLYHDLIIVSAPSAVHSFGEMEKLLRYSMTRGCVVLEPVLISHRSAPPPKQPTTQSEFAQLVNHTATHQIRQGYSHRFIDILFVTVGDRVFCRRYSYTEPSWYSAFEKNAEGQVKLDKIVVNVKGSVPFDLDSINPSVNKAYEVTLKKMWVGFMLKGATKPKALASTFELVLNEE